MTQEYLPYNLTCESESDDSDIFWYDSDEDEDRFCGDVEWEMSLAAVAWEARRKLYAEEMIKQSNEEEALTHIRFLFVEEEVEVELEDCVTEKPNWDWDRFDSDCEYSSDSGSDYDDDSAFA